MRMPTATAVSCLLAAALVSGQSAPAARLPATVGFMHAIHATSAVGRLGRPASHGCVRLAPRDAKALFDLVEAAGMKNVTIRIVGAVSDDSFTDT